MTRLLEQAIREAVKLPPDQQDAIASLMLAEMASEQRWDEIFAQSQDLLAQLAAEAIREDEAGLKRL